MPTQHASRILQHIATGSGMTTLDVAGLTVEFLTGPQDAPGDFCVMRGTIPPGAVVPIHSHDSTETFLVISGTKQALVPRDPRPAMDRRAHRRLCPDSRRPGSCSPEHLRRAGDRAHHHQPAARRMVLRSGTARHR